MKRGRKPLLKDQTQGICIQCNINKQTPAPNSKYGFKRYLPLCASCTKKKYGLVRKPYRKYKQLFCERCYFIAVDTCQLDVHHKDRNKLNNEPSNLETLCANCHRLEHKNEYK